MSRRTTMEFVGVQGRACAQLKSKAKKTALTNSMCQAFGFDRKYANRLLTGNRKRKDPKGRGKTYSDKATALFRRVWYATGCMCMKYLKAIIVRALANLAELDTRIRPHFLVIHPGPSLRYAAAPCGRASQKRKPHTESRAAHRTLDLPCFPGCWGFA